jgi:cysteine-rich repeat protein
MRCLPLPGYYNAGVSQAAPCVAANCLTCTSTTYCLSCALGKYLVTSTHTCATCMANCLNCTSGTTCLQCSPYYVFSVSACVPNCSNITYCTTCTVSFGIVCSACSTGYSLVNNVCQEVCGDSMMVTPEQCDDGNTDPNDGCSSTCQIEVQHYCDITATPSQCGNCVSNCDNCTNAIACTVCSTGYALSSGLCVLDCSVIANCSACSYDAIIKTVCTACYTGYTVAANNTCAS